MWESNYRVYGVRKLWKAARRAGMVIGLDQTARLMRAAGLETVEAGEDHPARSDPGEAPGSGAPGVHRDRAEPALGDGSDVRAHLGRCRLRVLHRHAFSRMIVGWRVASHMRTEMVLDAIEMARWSRSRHHDDLRCHSDAGSQFTSIRYGERLVEIGATPSIGTVGDSYDNAPAETVNGYYKPNSSAEPHNPGRGRPSRISSSRPPAGCTGTTRSGSTATWATSRRSSSRTRSLLSKPTANCSSESNCASFHQTQGASPIVGMTAGIGIPRSKSVALTAVRDGCAANGSGGEQRRREGPLDELLIRGVTGSWRTCPPNVRSRSSAMIWL